MRTTRKASLNALGAAIPAAVRISAQVKRAVAAAGGGNVAIDVETATETVVDDVLGEGEAEDGVQTRRAAAVLISLSVGRHKRAGDEQQPPGDAKKRRTGA